MPPGGVPADERDAPDAAGSDGPPS